MEILIAEDDPASRRILELTLRKFGYGVRACENGDEAWDVLRRDQAPSLAILDWMMPGLDGVEICRRVKGLPRNIMPYLILLTAKSRVEDLVIGIEAGADDYLSKPFHRDELRVRTEAGVRMIEMQMKLAAKVAELEKAFSQIKQLEGILPICSYCKNFRDDDNYWQQIESYLIKHSAVQVSHGICPACYEEKIKPEIEKWRGQNDVDACPA